MKLDIISIGKLSDQYKKLADEYCKMIKWKLKESEITYPKKLPKTQIKTYEAELIRKQLRPSTYKIILDSRGQLLTSEDLSLLFKKQLMSGRDISIVIGGAFGLDDLVIKDADLVLSLSKMTLPHQFVKLMILEQIYRTQSILEAHPYHK